MNKSSLFATLPGLAVLAVLCIVAAYVQAHAAFLVLLLLALYSLAARLWSGSVVRHASLELANTDVALHAGQSAVLDIVLCHHSRFPLVWLDIVLPLSSKRMLRRADEDQPSRYSIVPKPPMYVLHQRFAHLLWQRETRCSLPLYAEHRCLIYVQEASLLAGDALGLCACQRWFPLKNPLRICVYPHLYPVDISPFTALLSDAETGARGQMEDVTYLKGSRPYQDGDSIRRINWRLLAMNGTLEVNQYETFVPGCITFILDTASFCYVERVQEADNSVHLRSLVRSNALEAMISLIASCVHALNEKGHRFALIIPAFGDHEAVVCRPASGDGAMLQVMETLSAIDYEAQASALPADEIRRLRRRLGVVHVCSWSDEMTVGDSLEALGVSRLHCIACVRQEANTGNAGCLLLEDLSPEAAVQGGLRSCV